MMLCFTGTGEIQRVGGISMSEMWVRRARTLHAAEVVSAASTQAAITSIRSLASSNRVFDEVRFLGHGSQSSFYLFATIDPMGHISGPSTARLNLTQLDVPSDASYTQTSGFFRELAAVLPAQGGLVHFEACSVGGQLNLSKVRTVLVGAGRTCRVQGYPVQIRWNLSDRQGTRVQVLAPSGALVTVG